MEFGFDSCAKFVLKKGKLVQSLNLIPEIDREVKQLEQGNNLKILGS